MTALLASYPDRSLEDAAVDVLRELRGAFSLVFMDEGTLYAARDPQGIRPLVLGRLERGWVVASETAALDIVGASYVREVEPGELVAVDEHGLRTPRVRRGRAQGLPVRVRLPRPPRHPDLRPAGALGAGRDRPPAGPRAPGRRRPGHPGPGVRHARPRSATPRSPASRTARAWSRTPTSGARSSSPARPSASSASGSSSTRCGTSSPASGWSSSTTRSCAATPSARWCGCCARPGRREVHVRISSPPVKWPCFYGIDFASRAELVANGLSVDEICPSIGADSLGYVDLDELVAATNVPADRLCRACFDGVYPVPLPTRRAARQAPARARADREHRRRRPAHPHRSAGGRRPERPSPRP